MRRERWEWGGPGTGLWGRWGACNLGQGEEGCGGEGPLPRAETGRGVCGQGPGCPLENSPSSARGSRAGLSAGAGGQGQNHAPGSRATVRGQVSGGALRTPGRPWGLGEQEVEKREANQT